MKPPGRDPRSTRPRPAAVSVDRYRSDPMYRRIVGAVAAILERGKVVAPVDVLVGMGLLTRARLEAWRRGRAPYLEDVIEGNLTRLSRLLRILRYHAHDLHLVPSTTACLRSGKGPKQRLRFTRTGDAGREAGYARNFEWPGKGPFHPPAAHADAGSTPAPTIGPSEPAEGT